MSGSDCTQPAVSANGIERRLCWGAVAQASGLGGSCSVGPPEHPPRIKYNECTCACPEDGSKDIRDPQEQRDHGADIPAGISPQDRGNKSFHGPILAAAKAGPYPHLVLRASGEWWPLGARKCPMQGEVHMMAERHVTGVPCEPWSTQANLVAIGRRVARVLSSWH
jgi:hypothetical protein